MQVRACSPLGLWMISWFPCWQLAKAAEMSGSLYYTFGTGTEDRACAFLPYFKAFMTDLQKELAKTVA